MSIIKDNPNASTAGATTGVGLLVVWGLGAVGVPIPPEIAVAAVGVATTALLFVGRVGLRGVWRRVWGGSEADQPEDESWEG